MSEELSVSIDVKCDKVNTKAFATELVKSMNQVLAHIIINSMNVNLSKQISDLEVNMAREISAAARKADAAYEIASKTRSELDELRLEVTELKQWCNRLQSEATSVKSQQIAWRHIAAETTS